MIENRQEFAREIAREILGEVRMIQHLPFGHACVSFEVLVDNQEFIVKTSNRPGVFDQTANNLRILSELGIPVPRLESQGRRDNLEYLIYRKIPGRDLGFELLYHSHASPEWILFAARFVTILLTLLFAAWLAFWNNKHFGPKVALVALTFFVLDPNITAHGRYVTTDIIASLFIFVSCSLWIDYLMKRSRLRLAAAGISLGLALASKYSTIFLIPAWMLMYMIADFAKHRVPE